MRKHHFVLSKIVATLGPASAEVPMIRQLIDEGVRVFRINFSHGTFEDFERMRRNVREAAKLTDRYIGVLGDLSGPKLRVGKVVDGGVDLTEGGRVRFVGDAHETIAPRTDEPVVFGVNRSDFLNDVQAGHRVYLDDGNVRLECLEAVSSSEPELLCEVKVGGRITSAKGINLPDTHLSLPSLTEWDEQCVEFAVKAGFDLLALSFVRRPEDVRELKDRLRELGARPKRPIKSETKDGNYFSTFGSEFRAFIPVVSKIEKPQAMECLGEILEESDVIMVARGDLGVEMDVAEVPISQKKILRACHHHGKPTIVATQMLQSMVDAPVPTRAEATDVANAIFDGTDCVMLSGETAVGKYPVETVRTMRRIACITNEYIYEEKRTFAQPKAASDSRYRTAALAHGVKVMVNDLGAELIVTWSQLGGGASYLAQNKLPVPILAFSSNADALRRMSVLYGVVPRYMDTPADSVEFVKAVDRIILDNDWGAKGDPIVMAMGEPYGQAGLTNKIRVHYVGEI